MSMAQIRDKAAMHMSFISILAFMVILILVLHVIRFLANLAIISKTTKFTIPKTKISLKKVGGDFVLGLCRNWDEVSAQQLFDLGLGGAF